MVIRSPLLYQALRGFCLGAFAELHGDLREGAQLGFDFERRGGLYEYRPLTRAFVDERARRLLARTDARIALEELEREPAARVHAAASGGLAESLLLPLLHDLTDACPTFDWDDGAFDRAYREVEVALFRGSHAYAAVVPLVGVSAGGTIDLGPNLRIRHAAPGELHDPLPHRFGREVDRLLVLELEADVDAEPPDAAGEVADAVTALRLATCGSIAAGPVAFERLDWRPFGTRPLLPLAVTLPPGEATRLDPFRGRLAADLRARLVLCDDDADLGAAVDLWELALVQGTSAGDALTTLLGGAEGDWAARMRAAVLLRVPPDEPSVDTVRRALVEVLVHGDRGALIDWLDDAMLGVRPKPVGYYATIAASGPAGASVAA